MNLTYLKYFLELAKIQHYGRAAELLGISQPGLSHAIAALEKELGMPLFKKDGRNIALNRFGKMLMPEAEKILSMTENCEEQFRMLRDGDCGDPSADDKDGSGSGAGLRPAVRTAETEISP